jgi:hypothetical protein
MNITRWRKLRHSNSSGERFTSFFGRRSRAAAKAVGLASGEDLYIFFVLVVAPADKAGLTFGGRPGLRSPVPVPPVDEEVVGEGPVSSRFVGKNCSSVSSGNTSFPGVVIVVRQFAAAVILVYFFSLWSRVILFM